MHAVCTKHWYCRSRENLIESVGPDGEGEVAVFSAKRWDCRTSGVLIESVTPCCDAQVVGPYLMSNLDSA